MTTIGAALADAVERFGDKEAYTFAGIRRLSFREVDRESDVVARAFLASGIVRAERVAIWMANHPEFPTLYFGLLKIGAVPVPLSTRLRPDELAFELTKSAAKMLLFRREVKGRTDYGDVLLEVVPELREVREGAVRPVRVPALRTVVDIAEPAMAGTLSYGAFLERAAGCDADALALAERAVTAGDEAIIIYTSGTTSFPKATRLSHVGMLRGAGVGASRVMATAADTMYSAQPYYHSGGAINSMLRPILTGCRVVTHAYFDPGDALDAMETERATILTGHQPHYVEYMNHPTLSNRRLSLERAFVIGPPELFVMVRDKLGIEGLVSAYGATETHGFGTTTSLVDDPEEVRFNTNGRPNPGVEVQIRDPDDGTLLDPGESGEIFLHVPYPMLGYLDEPELTAEVLSPDGWYRTGDRGVVRKDGNLCLLGRVRDMIRVGGENLAGAEVEAVLLQHPAVKQAAAVAEPDPRLGEHVIAFVELKPGASAGEPDLIEHCRAGLAQFKVPRAVYFVTEWPLSGSGKLQRRLLKPVR